ncbi:MAG: pre-16S rRNA-processing nuclease YqgF [Oscillatoriales cyanobacterium SM2_2_1]|nr:pre-16S rRNA-processing nuclease YqgF [Oscillatoriales cyanobacterium SM2_2_1]
MASGSMPMIRLGFDPGQRKCGVAIAVDGSIVCHHVVPAEDVQTALQHLYAQYPFTEIIMGNQTGSRAWGDRLGQIFPTCTLIPVNETNSSAEARRRYWQMYPARGLTRVLPLGLRQPPRPIDDIVAIILLERLTAAQQS